MFFSAREYYEYKNRPGSYSTRISMSTAKATLKEVRRRIVARQMYNVDSLYAPSLGKWLRPWDVVPKLREFTPPEGDFGVGVEIEFGFNSRGDASRAANHVKNWRYVCIDNEGDVQGNGGGLEVTFPPMLASKISNRSQCMRYLDFLKAHENTLYRQTEGQFVGTHVNVSMPGGYDTGLAQSVVEGFSMFTFDEKRKYFGRGQLYNTRYHPYTKFIEWKMFNSTTDKKQLMRYINVAIELTKLCRHGRSSPTIAQVREACEAGYNKRR